MTDNLEAAEGSAPTSAPARRRGTLLRWLYPLAVIALIAFAIWYIQDQKSGGRVSPSGERYGPAQLSAALAPAGADIEASTGAYAPDFLLEQLDAGELRLSGLRGHPVVLNFWATWCAPCRKEIPQFVDAYNRYKDKGLVIVGLNLQEGSDLLRPFVRDFGMTYPIAIDRDGEVGDEYRLLGLPTTLFIGADGIVKSVFTGPFVEVSRGTNVQGAIEQGELDKRIAAIMATVPAATQAAH